MKVFFCFMVIILAGCSVNNNAASIIMGSWGTDQRETEWGSVVIYVDFYTNNTFEVRSFFSEKGTPMTIKGNFRVEDNRLYADSWNKGEPILISKENNTLILKFNDDAPLVLKPR